MNLLPPVNVALRGAHTRDNGVICVLSVTSTRQLVSDGSIINIRGH